MNLVGLTPKACEVRPDNLRPPKKRRGTAIRARFRVVDVRVGGRRRASRPLRRFRKRRPVYHSLFVDISHLNDIYIYIAYTHMITYVYAYNITALNVSNYMMQIFVHASHPTRSHQARHAAPRARRAAAEGVDEQPGGRA